MKKEFRFGVLAILIVFAVISTFPNILCKGSFWDQAQDWGSGISSQIDQWAQSTQDTFSDWSSKAEDKFNDWSSSAQDQIDDWSSSAQDQIDDWGSKAQDTFSDWSSKAEDTFEEWGSQVQEFAVEARESFGEAVETAKQLTGNYREEAYSILELEAKRQLCEDYADVEKVGDLQKKRGFLTEAAIFAIKLVPIYDSQTREVHTFDQFSRDLYSNIPGIQESDLGVDPVRCVALTVLDGDYLMYAKIIRTSDGRWMSIEEARTNGYRTSEVNSAKSDLVAAKQAYSRGDAQQTEKYLTSFGSKVSNINEPIAASEENANFAASSNSGDILTAISKPPVRYVVLIGIVVIVALIGIVLVVREKHAAEKRASANQNE